jgi:predicted nucleotidyltransferase
MLDCVRILIRPRILVTLIYVTAMKPSDALQAHRDEIRRVVEAHRAKNARIFGSVARGEDTEESDLDLLIDPTPKTSLLDIGAIRHELRELLGVKVDVLTPGALPERSRDAIVAGAVPV